MRVGQINARLLNEDTNFVCLFLKQTVQSVGAFFCPVAQFLRTIPE